MQNSPEISVIMPVYNNEKYLDTAIKSVLNQTYSNFEFIIIDDGSTDGSSIVLKELKEKQEYKFYFKLIKLDINSGKGKAIQTGIKNCEGEYILLQDADLELDPKDSREMYELIKRDSDLKVLFGSRFLSGKLRANRYFLNEIFVKLNSIIFNILFQQSVTDLHCGTKIVAKDVIDKIILTINELLFQFYLLNRN